MEYIANMKIAKVKNEIGTKMWKDINTKKSER